MAEFEEILGGPDFNPKNRVNSKHDWSRHWHGHCWRVSLRCGCPLSRRWCGLLCCRCQCDHRWRNIGRATAGVTSVGLACRVATAGMTAAGVTAAGAFLGLNFLNKTLCLLFMVLRARMFVAVEHHCRRARVWMSCALAFGRRPTPRARPPCRPVIPSQDGGAPHQRPP